MTDNHQDQAAAEQVIRFGEEPDQVIPLSWAEGMLADLFLNDPSRFGRLLSGYVTGIRQAARGPKPRS